ncbi:hypothetical protein [Aporhodopirellula aestuarii]|uniref:Uncharacterized protein n=1 Tax=Aporhodopirellula aestuarii TaxID=2950107 RepID=A0ABT0U467_9BACT|nr:hypothetical protein [Aporhodopirellula aestuarii]MCM2371720.1 hypothetical protein [Aporhodopirellula aestuarii]
MSLVERRQTGVLSTSQKLKALVATSIHRLSGAGRAYSFRRRRVVASLVVAVALAAVAGLVSIMHSALLHTGVMTGWMLMSCLVMLIMIGIRRRIPVLPLGTMSSWTQVHIYTGVFAIGVFIMHVPAILHGRMIANGYLEGSLSALFWLVSGSGVYGLIASRRLPWRLTNVGEQVRMDQIPWYRQQIAHAVAEEIHNLQNPAAIAVIGEFHRRYLSQYITGKPSLFYLLMPSSVRRRRVLAGLVELNRYLEEEGCRVCGRLAALVRKRDDLDYQYALQLRLRVWVMFHSTTSIVLLVMAIIHGVLAMRFVES